ncbi:MAG: IS110 family transposase [Rhodospirillales bacterium]|nr:IS110 family transposase [Rhodospirillales bacterium]
MTTTIVGLDLAKNVFQVHGVDSHGDIVIRKQLRRAKVLSFFADLPPCLVGMEACASSHYWGRELKLLGHDVRLMPPHYVKPYVKRGKSDAADAEAICEAVNRPSMRFVPLKGTEQQSILMLHRTRSLLVRQRTMLANALRSHLSEFGIVVGKGMENITKLAAIVENNHNAYLPEAALTALRVIIGQLGDLKTRVNRLEKEIISKHRKNPESKRLATIPGIGPITASALSATITDATQFKSGRQLAAWLGLVPRQNSSGGKQKLGRISKQGDQYLRQLLVIGATSMLGVVNKKKTPDDEWVITLLHKKPPRLVTVALANKMARIAWAVMSRQEVYKVRQVHT